MVVMLLICISWDNMHMHMIDRIFPSLLNIHSRISSQIVDKLGTRLRLGHGVSLLL